MWVQCYWTCLWLSVWGSSNCRTGSHWMGSGCLGWKKMKWMGDFYLGNRLMSRLYYFFSLSISFWFLRFYSISVFLSLAYSTSLCFPVDLMRPIIMINNSFNMWAFWVTVYMRTTKDDKVSPLWGMSHSQDVPAIIPLNVILNC